MLNRLISTKFHIPVWRQDWVSRPRLVESLIAGLQEGRKLFLISAPAGYGKTTVVTEWLHEIDTGGVGGRVAWLTLDDGDNDPVRYFNYWIAALQRVEPTIGQSAQSLLGMTQLPPLEAIMDELINDLAVLEDPLISVLDDNHSISNPDIHEAMEYFIDYQPRQLRLVITTRSDPPYSLSRLRVRQQLTEIRASDLRFNPQEMGDFFNEAMQLELDTQAIETLSTRTEGWAAGMQLAALVLQNLPDKQGFLADFSGSHRYVIDYLVDEVLNHQPPEIREFLSRTA